MLIGAFLPVRRARLLLMWPRSMVRRFWTARWQAISQYASASRSERPCRGSLLEWLGQDRHRIQSCPAVLEPFSPHAIVRMFLEN